ncbi:LOW QUALITY PROTEIN: GATOR complex protein WDR24 [Colias croceus]|uniref:LOW QUALITY PROTEIN: GATOR complex protein WDR24 n=1 Tax=Colias crocea TaxID=72248 RepID=UPI001E27DF87|nr:LOW QUALITY PROTEIN: GATOR complex protein WDR24 [Colias croceus]
MIPSNTICVSQEGPANALALNKDCSQVVIAGRNVFKVFSIGEDEFSEVCNLRVGKNLNLNFSSIDVAWSTIEENTLATAATNGAVVVWNLGRSGRSKQEHVFSDHKRTVNKVSFHLTEPSLLISGSQDGMMKCFDLRMKEVARTFISNTESIRDVQFSPHTAHLFAAVSENGTVQLWDARRHERALHQFTAHSGPVFACDWHPDVPWLATASRDKTIKVWDIHAKPNLEHTIYTIASVGHVKWRPQKKYQVASCALVLDCAVHVWDVRRPHVPLATFAEHRDVTTAIAWQASPHTFLSTSRDCSLYRHRFTEAAHPVLWANPHGVCVSARSQIAHALPERPLPARAPPAAPPPRQTHAHARKQPTAGSLGAAAQAALERAFPGGAASTLTRHRAAGGAPVLACAARYRLAGAAPHDLARHNAQVARDNQRHMVAHVWEVVAAVYSARNGAGPGAGRAPPPAPPRDPPPRTDPAPHHTAYNGAEEEVVEETEEWESRTHKHSGVLGLPTHTIYIPPHKYKRDVDTTGWISAASAHYVDVDAADWTLPEEAFPLRAHPHAHAHAHTHAAIEEHDEHESANLSGHMNGHNGGTSGSPGGSTGSGSLQPSGGMGALGVNTNTSPTLQRSNSVTTAAQSSEEGSAEQRAGEVGAAVRGRGVRAALAPLVAGALAAHAALGDVQTAAGVLLALQERRAELLAHVDEAAQELWLLGYVELLQRHARWGLAAEAARAAWLGAVWGLSQQCSSVAAACARCGRRARRRLVRALPARAARALRRVRARRARPAGLVPGLRARRPPAPHAALAPGAPPVPRRLRTPLPARLAHPPTCWPGARAARTAATCTTCSAGTGRTACAPPAADTTASWASAPPNLLAWCQGCAHGGHLHHMQRWHRAHRLCPAGCGHHCQLG